MGKEYDYLSFLKSIKSLSQDEIFQEVLEYAIYLQKTYPKNKIESYFRECFQNGTLSVLVDRLEVCSRCIDRQIKIMAKHQEVVEKLILLKNNINDFSGIINKIVNEDSTLKDDVGSPDTVTSFNSYNEKAKELQGRLDALEQKVSSYESGLNDKLFSLIINTVAILGIFVAIAFAGFGANTLFSKVVFDIEKPVILNVFFLSLTALFVYNLLFLLFYCIFKIIERISSDKSFGFWKNCKVFLIIDSIALVAVVVMYFFCN